VVASHTHAHEGDGNIINLSSHLSSSLMTTSRMTSISQEGTSQADIIGENLDNGGKDQGNNVTDDDDDDNVQLNVDQSFETIGEDGDNDMESLLPSSSQVNKNESGSKNDHIISPDGASSITPLEMHMQQSTDDNELDDPNTQCLCGLLRPYRVGNVQILFPDYFHTSGWGVLGPHWCQGHLSTSTGHWVHCHLLPLFGTLHLSIDQRVAARSGHCVG
jgi:hypothetical protein